MLCNGFYFFLGWPIINLVIKCANKNLPPENPIDRGEFLRFIGLWLLMSTIGGGFDKMEHWSSTAPSPENGAPFRFNEWMSKNRFKNVQNTLRHADEDKPSHIDKFFVIRKILSSWNQNIQDVFRPGWLNCLDESMSMWNSKTSCPGWVFSHVNLTPSAMNTTA